MTTITKLKKILTLLEEAGHGEEMVSADHDIIFLMPPDKIEEDSELGKKLDELGCHVDDSDGWSAFV